MTIYIKKSKSTSTENLYQDIDNPGKGDCGFYAFAIGLINIIQTEIYKGNDNPEQLKILNRLTTIVGQQYTAQDFLNFKNNLKSNSRQLLIKMKTDLRQILYLQYLQEIVDNSVAIEGEYTIEQCMSYIQFSQIFHYYHSRQPFDKEFNFLWMSTELCKFASHYAKKYQYIQDPVELESCVKALFMQDIYGEDYQKITVVPWQKSMAFGELLYEEQTSLALQFKQFLMVVVDYYTRSFSSRNLDANFKLKKEAIEFADVLRQQKESLHQCVKIVVGDELINQNELEPLTLYLQLLDGESRDRVYSPALSTSYYYTVQKGQSLINMIRHKFPKFSFDKGSELTLEKNSKKELFREFSLTADDTLNDNLMYKKINEEFLKLYSQEKFNKLPTDLDNDQQLELERDSLLLKSDVIIPLSLSQKNRIRAEQMQQIQANIKESSRILAGLSQIKLKSRWLATARDLCYLAAPLKVNINFLENGKPTEAKGTNYSNWPNLTIDNLDNYHWITRLQLGYFAGKSAEKYASWVYEDRPLCKKEIKNLMLSYTTGFVSFFGRTHLDMADEIIVDCDNPNSTVASIMQKLDKYMFKQNYNPNSSFLKRFEYLEARYRSSENATFRIRDIERIFANYVHTGYFRNHLPEARRIIADCKNPSTTIDNIVARIQGYVDETKEFNSNSDFIVRFNQVKKLKKISEANNFFPGEENNLLQMI
ncbi:MAG: hypothetical protein H0U73_08230 [Tatlockia sp.]|nr:hypothetical protein [Tatlockia sp.]